MYYSFSVTRRRGGEQSQAFHDSLTMAGIEWLLEDAKNHKTFNQTTCACLLKFAIAKPDGVVEFELKNGVVLTGRLLQKGWGTGKANRTQSEDTADGEG